ncbi:SDR family NAD(P)-dependent oxidoreductase [Kaistella polysaccharea]|uniref:SDR family NAD(P)-dependent oxidoreductase n=1 Tax=Kaistella polysaccharea TaxID=2878534 RepID=UPI001CF360A1|nr:SDR family NAD(P)-dependent oxidoreductase [Kaistella polysaccharea]
MKKKIVLITGVSKGIGKALAEKMLAENYFVIGTSRTGEIKEFKGDNFYALALDLTSPQSIDEAQKTILEKFDHLDILINNAGVGPDLGTQQPDRKSFAQTFEVNVSGTVFFTEPLINLISDQGKVINISSRMGSLDECETADSVAYRMSKSALNMYTKILTNRLKGKVKVAAVHPGWVKTTIRESNLVNGTLTPEKSAENIYRFITNDFESGTFWNAEKESTILW